LPGAPFLKGYVMIGRLIMFGVLGVMVWKVPIILAIVVLFFLGVNLAHGKSEWPKDYYRKSKAPVTWKQKINPWWWMLNDDDPVYAIPADGTPVKNDWFHPTWPQWFRKIAWGWRNPTCNLDRYVLGFWDKRDWWTRERGDNRGWTGEDWNGKDTMWPLPGERWAIALPFISFQTARNKKGKYWEFYLGWKPNSEFALGCFRRKG